MNNPFLADRKIFSKVIVANKAPDQTTGVKKADSPKSSQLAKPSEFLHQQAAKANSNNYLPAYQYKVSDQESRTTQQHLELQPKMTFGQPRQSSTNQYSEKTESEAGWKQIDEQQQRYQYQSVASPAAGSNNLASRSQHQQYKTVGGSLTEWQGDGYKDNYSKDNYNTSYSKENYKDNSKSCYFKEVSPIGKFLNHDDSQFLNIQTMNEDIMKFLAQPEGKDQICKMLGIELPKPKQQVDYTRKSQNVSLEVGSSAGQFGRANSSKDQNDNPSKQQQPYAPVLEKTAKKGQDIDNNNNGYNDTSMHQYASKAKQSSLRPSNFAIRYEAVTIDAPLSRETVLKQSQPGLRQPLRGYEDEQLSLKGVHNSQAEEDFKLPSFQPVVILNESFQKSSSSLLKSREQAPANTNFQLQAFSLNQGSQHEAKTSQQFKQDRTKESIHQRGQEAQGQDIMSKMRKEMDGLAYQAGQRIFLTTSERIVTIPYKLLPL